MKWLNIIQPWSLSTSENGQVVVGKTSGNVFVYGPDGEMTATVSLSSLGLEFPLHVLQSSTGNWIVCHGEGEYALRRIVEMDRDGKVIDSFGGLCGDGPTQLDNPLHMALAGDQIVVADRRLLLIDRRPMKLSRILLDKSPPTQRRSPSRVYFVRDCGRLLVGFRISGIVQVYEPIN